MVQELLDYGLRILYKRLFQAEVNLAVDNKPVQEGTTSCNEQQNEIVVRDHPLHSGVCSTRPGSRTSLLLYLSLTSVIVIEYTKEGLKH